MKIKLVTIHKVHRTMFGPSEALYRCYLLLPFILLKALFLEESNIQLLNSLKLQYPDFEEKGIC